MKKNKKRAFTLAELIVVITVLAILGTIGFMSFQSYSKGARDSKRVSDINNIKTSLETFFIKNGEYSKPDSFSTISYSGTNVWYQGTIGDSVILNLINLNEKPIDPLMNTEYIYSVTESFEEYEVLALYEGSMVAYNSILSQTNAAVTTLTPKIEGNYNKLFVETPNYIIPTPSIITSEPLTGGILKLNPLTIKSQVVTNGINMPNTTLIKTITGSLNINLSVYTGTITTTSTDTQKINAIKQIQNAYTGSTISNKGNISYILNKTSTGDLLALSNTVILKIQTSLVTVNTNNTPPPPITDWRSIDLSCDKSDVVIGTGTWAGCNSTIGNGAEYGQRDTDIGTNNYNGSVSSCYKDYSGTNLAGDCVIGDILMSSITKENLWFTGSTTNGDSAIANIWGKFYTFANSASACTGNYRIPTDEDWYNLEVALGSTTRSNNGSYSGIQSGEKSAGLGWLNHGTNSLIDKLGLPLSGRRSSNGSSFYYRGKRGYYWTNTDKNSDGTTNSTLATGRSFDSLLDTVQRLSPNGGTWRKKAYGFSVRCIKI